MSAISGLLMDEAEPMPKFCEYMGKYRALIVSKSKAIMVA